jgi:DNA-binding CsgD family transcriptional regulator
MRRRGRIWYPRSKDSSTRSRRRLRLLRRPATGSRSAISRRASARCWKASPRVKTIPEIAAVLGLSEKTVRNHITRVFDKIGVEHRCEAIVRAREADLGMNSKLTGAR